jgi:hypothetical protein
MIHYVEGRVMLEGQPVDVKFAEFPQVKDGQVLATEEGRAEVLLTPGAFLRLAENSAFKMESGKLSDTVLEIQSGSALFEIAELLADNSITVHFKDSTIELVKKGLYRFDATANRMRVYDGEARVTSGQQTVTAKKGREIGFGTVVQTASFDTKSTDAFYRWASRRAENIAMANVSSAQSAASSGSYVSGYGSWAWNPWYGMFTYLPGRGYGYSPFGWMFYSPVTVYYVYYPQNGGFYGNNGYGAGGGGQQPAYSVTNTGAVALTPDRAGPVAPMSGGGPAQMSGTAGIAGGGASVSRGASVSGSRGR